MKIPPPLPACWTGEHFHSNKMKRQTKDARDGFLWRVEKVLFLDSLRAGGYNVFDLFLLLVLAIVIEDD